MSKRAPLTTGLRIAAALGLLAVLPIGVPPTHAGREINLKSWIEGPVRYISESEERKIFKKLETEADRALFIARFWARRDPLPETLANEYRQSFWERVQETNSLFLDSHKPGWTTDRGKIYILYGPPTRIEDYPNLATESSSVSGHGLLRWIYEGRPEGRSDLNPVVVVPFERLASGEYRVSYDPKLSGVSFDELAVRENWNRGVDRFLEIFGAPRPTEMSVMLDLGKMQEVPPQAQILLERVETMESFKTQPIQVVVGRFLHPDRSGVLAVVTADVSHVAAGTRPAVIARFTPHDTTGDPRILGEDSFRVAEFPGGRVAQGRLVLDPGNYDVTVFVADPATAVTGMFRSTLMAPEGDSTRLRLSDVVLAEELAPLEFASLASHDEPFLLGPFEVVPRANAAYHQGDSVKLLFEVYGAVTPFRVGYQVEGQDLDGSWVELGRPSVTEQTGPTQAWELPTSTQWPSGEYRIRIEVEDSEDHLMTLHVPFVLEAAGESP